MFATRTDVSQNDKAILLKAEYYLLRLSRVLYVNKIDSALFSIREPQNALPELHSKTRNLLLRNHYEGIIRLLVMIQSELVPVAADKNENELSEDYLKAVDFLTIDDKNTIAKQFF